MTMKVAERNLTIEEDENDDESRKSSQEDEKRKEIDLFASSPPFLTTPPTPTSSENNDDLHFSVQETTTTMHKPPSPKPASLHDSVPFDLVEEILMHLPGPLSSDLNHGPGPSPSPGSSFHHVILSPMPSPPPSPLLRSLTDYSLHSVVNTSSSTATYSHRVNPFGEGECLDFETDSCHGMLLVSTSDWDNLPILWNPTTGKFKTLPSLDDLSCYVQYGFGYDRFTDTYKVVAVSSSGRHDDPESYAEVHTLGTDSWRYVPDFPNAVPENSGVFVNGTFNWLVAWDVGMGSALNYVIASMDLRTETFQELLPPVGAAGDIVIYRSSFLCVLKGCLCLLCNVRVACDVWVMKEYGNDESWSKLFSVPYCHEDDGTDNSSAKYIKALWISDKDDEILLESSSKFVVHDHKNGTLKTTIVKRFLEVAQAYVETLISP
ncbi:hypothetical protein PIB30_018858 [Stylosanthes scabra]|uniref:F-box associated beta-propeller type 1 domain-containing protein n=1 Tax=Stylosanthes scabra TaxID=79078 RepID=A0ABU6U926_9FABA|nr:hypothetical protein [Stylosanthes scabra]